MGVIDIIAALIIFSSMIGPDKEKLKDEIIQEMNKEKTEHVVAKVEEKEFDAEADLYDMSDMELE